MTASTTRLAPLATALALILFASPAAGQEDGWPAVFRDVTEVNVVNVEVFVTDHAYSQQRYDEARRTLSVLTRPTAKSRSPRWWWPTRRSSGSRSTSTAWWSASSTKPPYRLRLDLGDDVAEHRIQVIAYGVSGATGTTELVTPPLRVDDEVSVNLQQLYVTVSRRGERVLDLAREEFQIFDENRRQDLVTFARGDIPLTALVLLDASTSMTGRNLQAALSGAEAFFTGMRPLDEGRLLVFSDRILHTTPFTTFPEVLTAGLGRVEADGGTAINDHLYLALKQLEAHGNFFPAYPVYICGWEARTPKRRPC